MRMRQPAPKRDRRESGKTWRDYTVGEEDDDFSPVDDVDSDSDSDSDSGEFEFE